MFTPHPDFLRRSLRPGLHVGVAACCSVGMLLFGTPVLRADSAAVPSAASASVVPGIRGPLSLSQARLLAFQRNWDLLAARADVDIAQAQSWVAREFPNPTVGLTVSKINTDGRPASTVLGNSVFHRNYDTIASFNQLVEIGGKRSARRASALAGIDGAKARFADARRQLDLAVAQAYSGAALAAEKVRILNASAASLRQELSVAEVRLKAGDISRSDHDQISIAADRLELDARRAEADAIAARIQLEILLGEPTAKGTVVLAEGLDQLVSTASDAASRAATAPSLDAVVAQRSDVQALRADERKAAAEVKAQRAQRIPDPTFLVQYEREPADQPNTVGFGVSFPIPLWNRNRGAIAAATAAREQAQVRVKQAEAAAAADVVSARTALSSAEERRQRYTQHISPRSAEITKTVRFAYQKGGASLLDLLTAERNDNDVRLAAAQASAEAVQAAAAVAAAESVVSSISLSPSSSKP